MTKRVKTPSLHDMTISMASDPRKWPQWPFLPVKEFTWPPDRQRKLGYLIADGTFNVRQGNIWDPHVKTDPIIARFATAVELADANWVVD